MDASLLWRAALVQLLAVAVLFALLLAAPLSEDFFRHYGAVVGPVSWLACSSVTGRVLSLGTGTTLRSAVGGGLAGGIVGVLLGHSAGLVVGVALFGTIAAARGRERVPPEASPLGAR